MKKPMTLARLNKIFENAEYRYRGLWALNKKNKNLDQEELDVGKRYKVVELPHGPIIDVELLDNVLQKLKDNYDHKKRKTKDHVYLLSTLLRYEDESNFTGQPAKQRQYRYYYNKKNDIRIRCEELDKAILKRMREYIRKSPILDELIRKAQKEKMTSLPSLNKQLREIEAEFKRLERLEDELQAKIVSSEDLKGKKLIAFIEKKLEAIDKEREAFEKQKSEVQSLKEDLSTPLKVDNIKLTMERLLKGFSSLSGNQKRRMAEQIFEKIVIKKDQTVCLHIYDDFTSGLKKSSPKVRGQIQA